MIPIPAQSFAAISRKLPVPKLLVETPRGFSLIRLVEDILVLCIAQGQSPLACLFSEDELKAAVRGIYRNHRDRAIIVLA
jgi:hypothetical protein